MPQERHSNFNFFCQIIRRTLNIDLSHFFETVEQLLDFLHEIFELYHNLKRQYLPAIRNRIQVIWSQWGNIITGLAGIAFRNTIFDPEISTKVFEFLSQIVGGIPAAIQLMLMGLYINQVVVFFANRSILSDTLSQFKSFESKLIRLHEQTQELEEMIFQYANNEGNQQELLERINAQFEIVKTIDKVEIRQQFKLFKDEMNRLLGLARVNQDKLKENATLSFVYGIGSYVLGVCSVFSPPVAAIGVIGGTLSGATALYFNSQVKKEILIINETLEKINMYEQLAEKVLKKIQILENRHIGTTFVKICFKYAFWILLFVKMYDQFQNQNKKMFLEM